MDNIENQKESYFAKLKKGLEKTSKLIKISISDLFSGSSKKSREERIEELEQALIESDIGVNLAIQIIDDLKCNVSVNDDVNVKLFLEERILKEFLNCDRKLKKNNTTNVVLFIGINGAGKTTSISKIACKLIQEGNTILLSAGDTFRAAAIEQLSIWAERLKVPIIKHKMGADSAAVAHDSCESALAKKIDYVLIDTAGRLHNQGSLMEELKKITRVIKKKVGDQNLECLLVLDGNAGQNSLMQAIKFHEEIGVDGIIITKLDGTAKGGVIVSIEKELKIPVKYIGVGEKQDDIIKFDPKAFVKELIE